MEGKLAGAVYAAPDAPLALPQGVEAQTLANVYLAIENNLEIIPVINKIDLPGAEPERVKKEIEEVIGLDCSNAILASAKVVSFANPHGSA